MRHAAGGLTRKTPINGASSFVHLPKWGEILSEWRCSGFAFFQKTRHPSHGRIPVFPPGGLLQYVLPKKRWVDVSP
jgi:hypothetical protein